MDSDSHNFPPLAIRVVVSIALVVYLAIMLLGPLANPISSADLTGPMAQKIRPIHQAMFLGHGYRFFGPDPGPSHIVHYEITRADEPTLEGQFPDRDQHRPRLMYHRWFMLSETLYEEFRLLPTPADHRNMIAEMNHQIAELRMAGQSKAVQELIQLRDVRKREFPILQQRVNALVQCVARYLLKEHEGISIRLWLQERRIAPPADTQSRIPLRDARYLSEKRLMGEFSSTELLPEEVEAIVTEAQDQP